MKKTALVLLVMVFLFGCGSPQDKLLGTWKTVSGGEEIYITFSKNNELNVNNEIYMKYFVGENNTIVLGEQNPVPFSITGNMLTIEQEGHTLRYIKVPLD